MEFDRISRDPAVMGGEPIIRGMRFPVRTVQRMLEHGMSDTQILEEHPSLELEDLHQVRSYLSSSE